MATEVRLPREGSTTMSSGVVIEWYVAVGDEVQDGQPLAEIETDKVSIEVVAPVSGTVLALHAAPEDEVDVGGLLASIGDPSEILGSVETERGGGATVPLSPPPDAPAGTAAPPAPAAASVAGRVPAAPAARRLAGELGIDITGLAGSGPAGRVTVADVEAAAGGTTTPPAAGDDQLAGLDRHRRLVAERMLRGAHETAAVTLTATADVTRLRQLEAQAGRSFVDRLAHLVALHVGEHADLNTSLTPEGVVHHERVGLGYAVDSPGGLVVPVVADADTLDLEAFSRERRRLVAAAQSGNLTASDVSGGTFTITNLGLFGIEFFTPIITPGQCAVLGIGAVSAQVAPGDDGPRQRDVVGLSLTFDHRLIDGAPAARFLQGLIGRLSSVEEL